MHTPSTTPTDTAATASVSGLARSVPFWTSRVKAVVEGHVGAADRRRPGAAVGLQHVAVHRDLQLPQGDHVAHRAQGASDEPLDLLGPPRLLALGRLAGRPVRRSIRAAASTRR